LDVLVNNISTKVITSTFRKPINTGLLTTWSSFLPVCYKMNLVNCQLDRCYLICSLYEIICKEVERMKHIFCCYGYPKYFIDKCIRRFFNCKFSRPRKPKSEELPLFKMIMVRLPYLGVLSSQIEKEIGPFLRRQTSGRVKLKVIDKLSKIT